MGFKPMTQVILVQCSTNWAIKLTGTKLAILWAHNKPLDGEDADEYMKDHNYILTVEKDSDTVM